MNLTLPKELLERRVFNKAVYDLHVRDYMLGQTERFIDKNKCVIDIGAATGMYSAFWAQFAAHVYAFEAVTPVFEQLIKVERSHSNISAFNFAVSDTAGTKDFYVDDKRLSNSGFTDLVGGQKVVVPTIRLDDISFRNIGFIKVDVEGHELAVLKGATNLIEKERPICMVEIYPKFNNGPVEATFQWFFERGYHCFYNKLASGLVEVKSVDEGAAAAHSLVEQHDGDFLFIPAKY